MSVAKGLVLFLLTAATLLTLVLLLVYIDLLYFIASLLSVPSEVVNRFGLPFIAVFSIAALILIAILVFAPILSLLTGSSPGCFSDHSILLLRVAGRALAFALPYYILALFLCKVTPYLFLLSFSLFTLTLIFPQWISIVARRSLESDAASVLTSVLNDLTAGVHNRSLHIGAVEIEGIPEAFMQTVQNNEIVEDLHQRFCRLLAGLSHEGKTFAFRLCFNQGDARILIEVSAKNKEELTLSLRRVNTILLSYFPGFRTIIREFRSPTQRETKRDFVQVIGEPTETSNPLKHLAEYFIHSHYTGDYIAIAKGEKPSRLREILLRERYRNLSREADKQESHNAILGQKQITKHTADYSSQELLADTERQLSRTRAESLLKCWIYISAQATTNSEREAILEGAVSTLTPPLSSEKKLTALRTITHKGERITEALDSLKTVGSGTILLPSEATPYFWIPQTDPGIETTRTAEFPVPPQTEGDLLLGQTLRLDRDSGRTVRIQQESLRKHTLIAGVTGSGKTNTCLHISSNSKS